MIKRQETLGAAWSGLVKASPPDDKEAFLKAWTTVRGAALRKAGMEVIFE